jgi:hypothetical protein
MLEPDDTRDADRYTDRHPSDMSDSSVHSRLIWALVAGAIFTVSLASGLAVLLEPA